MSKAEGRRPNMRLKLPPSSSRRIAFVSTESMRRSLRAVR
jgi:hypothetical protein